MKILVVRLSSLGDLILSTSGLFGLPDHVEVHWLTASEYASLLEGHPRIEKVLGFDRRKMGLFDWLKFCLELRRQGFDEIVDLHRTLRTGILRLILLGTPWRSIRKRRLRRFGLFLFKNYWPRGLSPRPWAQEFSEVLCGNRTLRPDFRFLLKATVADSSLLGRQEQKVLFAVMPDSAWEGKCWPTDRYLELISKFSDGRAVILGTKGDLRSRELIEGLKQRGLDFQDARGLAWKDLASVISRCTFLVGNDTGMVHFAEALGVPVVSIFGPTTRELGFPPQLSQSQVVECRVGCRPCSTDGSLCYWRGESRYACLKKIDVSEVNRACREVVRVADSTRGVALN